MKVTITGIPQEKRIISLRLPFYKEHAGDAPAERHIMKRKTIIVAEIAVAVLLLSLSGCSASRHRDIIGVTTLTGENTRYSSICTERSGARR